jgi:putative protease
MPVLEGDFSLNAANAISAAVFLRAGLARLSPTHDLNAAQICALARALSPQG